jgi:hypothetical protein
MGLKTRLYPELKLFPDWQHRQAALSEGQRAAFKRPALWVLSLMAFCAGIALITLSIHRGIPNGMQLPLMVVGQLTASWGPLMGLWVFRRTVRQSLRVQLRERGRVLCISCGYDLEGLKAERCPECGAPVGLLP